MLLILFISNFFYSQRQNIYDYFIKNIFENYDYNIADVNFILKYALNIDLNKNEAVIKNEDDVSKIEVEKVVDDKPIIYLYNTHQEEKYYSNYINGYNVSAGVLQASKILKEYLKEYDINAIVEENSISEKLHSLNLKYGYSYKVSRMFLEDAYNKNNNLRYFIDIHRDSSKYDKTTIEINGIKYARLLFVIGLDNPNYELNLKMANNLRNRIEAYNKDLFRGIMKKSGKGVNGIYNQDFNSNVILIEVGGQYNSIEEVNNTLKILAKILSEYIKDDQNG